MHSAGQESAVPERLTKGKRMGEKRESREDNRGARFCGKVRARGSWAGGEWERCCKVDVRIAEEAEVDREEEGKVPDGSGGEAAREVRRAWAWRSAVEGSGGGEDSTGRGGKMGLEAGRVLGRDRESWTVT
jgi:hypothetical protein